MSGNGDRPQDIASALLHLRRRLREAELAPSKSRPHWSLEDMRAISALIEIPAAAEQIALARIEGLVAFSRPYDANVIKRVYAISRRALGLTSP